MTHDSFFVIRHLLFVVFTVGLISSAAAEAAAQAKSRNLRPQDDRLSNLLRNGSARSATFKALVDRIEASKVIVYVTSNPRMHANLSGMLTWMSRAGDFRYLRISINPDPTSDRMIATIAHELHHAVEVIEDDTVNDETSLVALYRRIGEQSGLSLPSRWETAAAQRTGVQVRKELVGVPTNIIARASEATQ